MRAAGPPGRSGGLRGFPKQGSAGKKPIRGFAVRPRRTLVNLPKTTRIKFGSLSKNAPLQTRRPSVIMLHNEVREGNTMLNRTAETTAKVKYFSLSISAGF